MNVHQHVPQHAHLFAVPDLLLQLHLALRASTVQWDLLVHLDLTVPKVHLVNLAHQVRQALQVHQARQLVHRVMMVRLGPWEPLETKVHLVIQVHKVHLAYLVHKVHQAWHHNAHQYVPRHVSKLVLPHAATACKAIWTI